jgi:hypothetical protein
MVHGNPLHTVEVSHKVALKVVLSRIMDPLYVLTHLKKEDSLLKSIVLAFSAIPKMQELVDNAT